MFELYLDSADINQISKLHEALPLKGVTTNPSILAESRIGVGQLLEALSPVLGSEARFHIQVVSTSAEDIYCEGLKLADLPFDIVVKVPADKAGLVAIKKLKQNHVPVLATAIYSVHQGFLAALSGADYLAPYVNRIDMQGASGLDVVKGLQNLIEMHALQCKILAASFKSTRQAMDVIQTGAKAITLPPAIAEALMLNSSVDLAIQNFHQDWQHSFADKLSYNS